MSEFFITGIGTGIGKTLVSAAIGQAFAATYWKPIQAGRPSDRDFIEANTDCLTIPEAYYLNEAISPHAAAAHQGLKIELENIIIPSYQTKYLLIEGVGGLLSPINHNLTNLDLIKKFAVPVIVVVSNYLGSISHSLLTLAILQAARQKILGIIVSGASNPESEDFIVQKSGVEILLRVPPVSKLNKQQLKILASQLRADFDLE